MSKLVRGEGARLMKLATGSATIPWAARGSTEHGLELGGLGLMAAGSADELRQELARRRGEEVPSLMGGSGGRAAADTAGLGMMLGPSLAGLRYTHPSAAGGGSRWVNALNAASVAALMAPSIDHVQAKLRSKPGEDVESKHLLSHRAHAALEIGGLGGLTIPVMAGMRGSNWKENLGNVSTLAGLGVLAAPHIEGGLRGHDHAEGTGAPEHEVPGQSKPFYNPVRKSVGDLAGLALLAAPAASHLMHSKHASEEDVEKVVLHHADALDTPRVNQFTHTFRALKKLVGRPDEGAKKEAMPNARAAIEALQEKLAAGPWTIPQARKGIRSMRVTTMLKKDAEGTLGAYKLAGSLDALTVMSSSGKVPQLGAGELSSGARTKRHPWEAPSRDDAYQDKSPQIQQRADAMVLPGTGTTTLVGT